MSSTGRGGVRRNLDAYYTPDDVARACVATLASDLRRATAWEPHAGGGAFVRALLAVNAKVTISDIDPAAPALGIPGTDVFVGDFLTCEHGLTPAVRPDWIIGNPPFSGAEAHVRHALARANCGVGFLLRLAFLESKARAPLWRDYPPASVHVLCERPSFTGGATDSAAYGWFIWRVGNDAGYTPFLHWMSWRGSHGQG